MDPGYFLAKPPAELFGWALVLPNPVFLRIFGLKFFLKIKAENDEKKFFF
jgi:hypothetical protein